MSASSPITLSARKLCRQSGGQQIVNDVSLELHQGEVLGLLGHNGAGKSTTLQILSGALRPSSGEIEIGGFDLERQPLQAKMKLGFLPDTPPLYSEMRVDDYLLFAARLHAVASSQLASALDDCKRRCGLQGAGAKVIANLSKGYQQRVGIAQAIIHQPDVVILDEPTVGLDPAQIRDIRALIRELGDAHSVILSTHLLSEVESICDRVEIIHRGRMIYSDSSLRMKQYRQQPGFSVTLLAPPELGELQAIAGVNRVEQVSVTQFHVWCAADSDADTGRNLGTLLLGIAAQRSWQAEQLAPLQTRLEDVFVQITEEDNS